ncbi:adenylate/guanylate cyclase domain-containing protein [Sulfitobacter aestuariivivens]|uniref:Nuclear transport factor 2 family protein n=1 Tax=Sulfitobacter aestuariivivens TaxID=2766981 RepID=A0A927HEX7_9RHOB|nr:adenylate/guanylate cyclase domain-containing protein [Sulfitobacter aestuariivivens]MBD3662650.1 nuclear transport factor 2 family protein [Sulfitobacter aestuariivivens]
MVRASPELLAISRRWFSTIEHKRLKELKNFVSARAYVRFLGSAEAENWSSADINQAIGTYFDVIPEGSTFIEENSEAFEDGSVGWSFLTHAIQFPMATRPPVVYRTTLIFAPEEGQWKIVHRHGSIPVANSDSLGLEVVSLTALIEAARDSYVHDQTEGLASVVFTDIVGSARMAEVLGDRLWSATMEDHFAMLRVHIERADGKLVKSMGDGTLSRFASARQALRAAKAMQTAVSEDADGPDLLLRVGVHTGDVVKSKDDFFGTVVNKAARLMSLAGPGQITVSDATRVMVSASTEFQFVDPVTVPLKGLEGDHLVHRLEWQS